MPVRRRSTARTDRRLYGFVDAVVPAIEASKYSRQILLLDCVDANAFDLNPDSIRESENLSLVRIQSTARRWEQDLGLPKVTEGDWLELTLNDDSGLPRAWVMPATDGYVSRRSTNLTSVMLHRDDPDLSADTGKRLQETCRLPDLEKEADDGRSLLSLVSKFTEDFDIADIEVHVLDVGQASCVVFLKNGTAIGFFDVGAPLYRNQSSFPKRLALPAIAPEAFVILSHWDFDHFDLARRHPQLEALKWFAPDQPVGPNTLKFQRNLGKRLSFIDGSINYGSNLLLRRGTSASAKDRNGNGYGLRLDLGAEAIVLTGDADYSILHPDLQQKLTAITVPHHGALGTSPPNPSGGIARAVASYGLPNCYRHPDEKHLEAHSDAGWQLLRTATHLRAARGNRRLYP
jgi:hypothetical protein